MELLSLPRLRMGELQSLAENAVKICKPLAELKTDIANVELKLASFAESMRRAPASASEKAELDKTRDLLLSGLFHSIKADSYYPYPNDTQKELSAKLKDIEKKYGFKTKHLPIKEETAAIDNLLADIKSLNPKALEQSNADRWVNLLKEANENYKQSELGYISEQASASDINTATDSAPELAEAIEKLCLKVFSFAQISDKKAFGAAYSQLSQLVASYR